MSAPINFRSKPDFGRVPEYLSHVKATIESEKAAVLKMRQEQEEARNPRLKVMPPEERQSLIEALRLKKEKVNREYQGMTHITILDTIGKRRKKELLERTLTQIDVDLEKLTSHDVIYIDTLA